jgi:tetratricopeptide (TPR) repeat protein/2-polyprenyl-3-methyl-5-hydroxy-6-metoxy-1,4-benzoquinol methylase
MAQNRARRSNKVKQRKKGSKVALQNVPEKLQATLSQAMKNHQVGLIDQAITSYRQILDLMPSYANANHLLGVALHQSGELEEAVSLIKKAIKFVADRPSYHSNLGNVLKDMGCWEEAIGSFRKALVLDPQNVSAHLNIGNSLNQMGRYSEAHPHLLKAIKLNPNLPEAHNNLGLMYHEGQSLLSEAIKSFTKALSLSPNFSEAHYNLGNAYSALGRLDEAIASYGEALRINPNLVMAHSNLGNVYKKQNRFKDAIDSYNKALSIDPSFQEMYYNLGLVHLSNGHTIDAFNCLRRAAKSCPEDGFFWTAWAESLVTYPFNKLDENLLDDLNNLLDQAMVSPMRLAAPILRALVHVPDFPRIMSLASRDPEVKPLNYRELAGSLSKIPLLIKLMGMCNFDDLIAERMLTNLRRAMILQLPDDDANCLPFSAALALHCFANEYVFVGSDEEKVAVGELERKVKKMLEDSLPVPALWVAALGAYRALHAYPWADKLLTRKWPEIINILLNHQVIQPKEEQALAAKIPLLSTITDSVSKAVREQYETNPYPRWIKLGIPKKGQSIAQVMRNIELPVIPDTCDFQNNPEVLIAGCGTGQQSITAALRFDNSKVTAVDLSLTSLAYAARKTQELGIQEIDYAQGDILELETMERQFDLIECTGVLHHLKDPMTGWRALLNLLRPNGLLKIALYSKIARRSVNLARALIKERRYASTGDGIRDCRRELTNMLKSEDSDLSGILTFSDFYYMSGCRDLLFHVHEHQFTIPQIEDALRELGLEFLGFEIADQTILRNFRRASPQYDARASLSAWHHFEVANPDTFRSMYQFWCRKKA